MLSAAANMVTQLLKRSSRSCTVQLGPLQRSGSFRTNSTVLTRSFLGGDARFPSSCWSGCYKQAPETLEPKTSGPRALTVQHPGVLTRPDYKAQPVCFPKASGYSTPARASNLFHRSVSWYRSLRKPSARGPYRSWPLASLPVSSRDCA